MGDSGGVGLFRDRRSFYATVECIAQGLDPLKTNLVVAAPDRYVNLCLAVSPSIKKLGVKNRYRTRDILSEWTGEL